VTRRGQTTTPAELRRKYGIDEGSALEIKDTGAGASFEEGTVDSGSRRDGKAVPERGLRRIGQDERGR